jgi:hypothetical protein
MAGRLRCYEAGIPLTNFFVTVDVDPVIRGSSSGGMFYATNVFAVLSSLCSPCCFDDRSFCNTGRSVAKRRTRHASPTPTPAATEAATNHDNSA